jgi:hypothetical protein
VYPFQPACHIDMCKATLRLGEHVTNLFLHEIALHQNQGAGDPGLQPPFPLEAFTSSAVKKDVPIGPAHIGALGECLTATHGILDTILSIELDILLTLPVIFCTLTFVFIYGILLTILQACALSMPSYVL